MVNILDILCQFVMRCVILTYSQLQYHLIQFDFNGLLLIGNACD